MSGMFVQLWEFGTAVHGTQLEEKGEGTALGFLTDSLNNFSAQSEVVPEDARFGLLELRQALGCQLSGFAGGILLLDLLVHFL
ncbi:MAG TPA: hypothetical protein VFA67_18295, partial [Candidatus Sulfotelmatobacter sp.]|nr:hypothetical protein [Candidatus Sulfotelmatobacter sp.]